MRRDVSSLCSLCLVCLKCKGGLTVPRDFLSQPRAIAPNAKLHFDYLFIRQPTATTLNNYAYCLVIQDDFSRFIEVSPCANATAEHVLHQLLLWFGRFGVVQSFSSDNGSHFLNTIVSQLTRLYGIHHHFCAAYSAWSNGAIERVNRCIRESLSALLLESLLPAESWPTVIPIVQMVLNHSPSARLGGLCPTTVMTGLHPALPVDMVLDSVFPSSTLRTVTAAAVQHSVRGLQQALTDMHANVLQRAQKHTGARAAAARSLDFSVGDFVLFASTMASRPRDKTVPIWFGPALCVAQLNPRVFLIRDLANNEHLTLHAKFIRRFAESSLVVTPAMLDIAAHGGRGWADDSIKSHRVHSPTGQLELEVLWQAGDTTFEFLHRLYVDVPAIVNAYVRSLASSEARRDLEKAIELLRA